MHEPSLQSREDEEQLTGGNTAETVIRIGDTVRKPAQRSTPAVHRLLQHLRSVGFTAVPQALGIDAQGRQVLEFVPGSLWHGDASHGQADLHRVGTMIRALHGAAASFTPPEDAEWDNRSEPNGHDLICHNDLAPWNLVCGEDQWVFIDWDAAAPATRLWDLAWAAISFPPFTPGCDLGAAALALHALLEGYGLEAANDPDLIRCMVTRAREECGFIVKGAESGQQPWARLHLEQHHLYWGSVADYIDGNAEELVRMLRSLRDSRIPSTNSASRQSISA